MPRGMFLSFNKRCSLVRRSASAAAPAKAPRPKRGLSVNKGAAEAAPKSKKKTAYSLKMGRFLPSDKAHDRPNRAPFSPQRNGHAATL